MGLLYKPYFGGDSVHFTPLPNIGAWKFESDFSGDQYRFVNPAYDECIIWIRRRIWTDKGRETPPEWRILLQDGNFACGANGKIRQFKTPERAIKAIEKRN